MNGFILVLVMKGSHDNGARMKQAYMHFRTKDPGITHIRWSKERKRGKNKRWAGTERNG